MKQRELTSQEIASLGRIISRATSRAIAGVGEMINKEVEVHAVNLRQIASSSLTESLRDPNATMIGVDMEIQGDASGNMLLIYSPEVAFGLIDLVMGNPPGQTTALTSLERSALAELANLMGGFLLGSFSDDTGLILQPSPPTVVVGTAAEVLGRAADPNADAESKVFVMQTSFGTCDRQIRGNFLVLPTPPLLQALLGYAVTK